MLKAAIVGLPTVGKTTLFNLLTGSQAATDRYDLKENVGIARVPDDRLDWLASLYNPRRHTPATIEFRDLPGLQPGAGESGAGRLLADIREVDALVHVLRLFPDGPQHPLGALDPQRDLETLELELLFSDLAILEKRLERIRTGKKPTPAVQAEAELIARCLPALEEGKSLHALGLSPSEKAILRNFGLLTEKPVLLVANLSETAFRQGDYPERSTLEAAAAKRGQPLVPISGRIEEEIAQLDPADRDLFLEDLGKSETGVERLSRATYDHLGLISFLTAGEDEVRAWTIARGTTAKEAAGKIHSDLERGFIRAEVVACQDLQDSGSLPKARERGQVRLEGKEYVVQDGDVVNFRFNV